MLGSVDWWQAGSALVPCSDRVPGVVPAERRAAPQYALVWRGAGGEPGGVP